MELNEWFECCEVWFEREDYCELLFLLFWLEKDVFLNGNIKGNIKGCWWESW